MITAFSLRSSTTSRRSGNFSHQGESGKRGARGFSDSHKPTAPGEMVSRCLCGAPDPIRLRIRRNHHEEKDMLTKRTRVAPLMVAILLVTSFIPGYMPASAQQLSPVAP